MLPEIKDSGNRQSFSTGAVRDTPDDKPQPAFICPFAKHRLGHHLAGGARKYSAWNWYKGMPQSRTLESIHRHLDAYAMGQADEDHLAAVMFNAMMLLSQDERFDRGLLSRDLDDAMPRKAVREASAFTVRKLEEAKMAISPEEYLKHFQADPFDEED